MTHTISIYAPHLNCSPDTLERAKAAAVATLERLGVTLEQAMDARFEIECWDDMGCPDDHNFADVDGKRLEAFHAAHQAAMQVCGVNFDDGMFDIGIDEVDLPQHLPEWLPAYGPFALST